MSKYVINTNRRLLTLITSLTLLLSCSSIDCPVQTKVAVYYAVPDTLKDTLWVWTTRNDGNDTLLLNRGVKLTKFELPISHQNPEDTLIMLVADTNQVWTIDTLFLAKEDIPHFESVDCGAHFFHRLTGLRYTRRGIDSITLNTPSVNYDQTVTNIIIRFKNRY